MPRRPRTVGIESSADLARKAEILEREMATQRAAIERLKEMGTSRHLDVDSTLSSKKPVQRSA
jgi:hypothetical protein